MVLNQGQPKTIDGLLVALQEEEFVCRARVKIEEDDAGELVKRQMIRLWFAYREQLDAAARFYFDWLLVIDGTFNTNKDRLPLLITVGALNSGKTFSACFSYCPSQPSPLPLYGTRSKENASNLREICLLFPISVSSSVAKLAALFLRFRKCSLMRSFRAVIGTLSKR
jgi:hypothetical protein